MDEKLYELMDWEQIEAVVYSEQDRPQDFLGARRVGRSSWVLVQAFLPGAKAISLKNDRDQKEYPMQEADEAGFFAALIPQKKLSSYALHASYAEGRSRIVRDAYQYPPLLKEADLKQFAAGKHLEIYRFLGAHPVQVAGFGEETQIFWEGCPVKKGVRTVSGTHFAVWAPNAMRVSVVGDFNGWDGRVHPMYRQGDTGVFSLFIPEVSCGALYKYEIKVNARTIVLKSDPYGFAAELRPNDASVVTDLSGFTWNDRDWMADRKKRSYEKEPFHVYEVHLGSWQRQEDGTFLNYRALAQKLAAYVKKMGYTHIELMPVMEHPLDASWGYQVTGYYAVTSRYGTPQDFMYFMDYMHKNQIGVILDWVPAHFPKDENGLARFDGTCLYEHLDPRQGEHPHWGTLIFNYGRPQVANFLIANAMFWKKVYHADGIRMDAVASMLYLDYGRQPGEWIPNEYGGNENLQAVSMIQDLSRAFHGDQDGALLIAEESTAWPMVTEKPDAGGLGFDLKWNMGWMHDFTSYMQTDPLFRKGRHESLLCSMVYAYSEKFLLPFSHDEVVHGKGSLLMKMPGEDGQKLGNLRAAFGFQMTHPGKKLQFMGQEFAQSSEWSENGSLPWEVLSDEPHQQMQNYVSKLNKFYTSHPALYEGDYDTEGFEWVSCLDADHSIVSFMRRDCAGKERLLVVCNFTPVLYENFKLGVPFAGSYKELFNSDAKEYGGTGCRNARILRSKKVSWDGREDSITVHVPPFGICIFQAQEEKITKEESHE